MRGGGSTNPVAQLTRLSPRLTITYWSLIFIFSSAFHLDPFKLVFLVLVKKSSIMRESSSALKGFTLINAVFFN